MLSFGNTVIQIVVHRNVASSDVGVRFGSTVAQVVVHPSSAHPILFPGFGGTVNQAVVHRYAFSVRKVGVSEVP